MGRAALGGVGFIGGAFFFLLVFVALVLAMGRIVTCCWGAQRQTVCVLAVGRSGLGGPRCCPFHNEQCGLCWWGELPLGCFTWAGLGGVQVGQSRVVSVGSCWVPSLVFACMSRAVGWVCRALLGVLCWGFCHCSRGVLLCPLQHWVRQSVLKRASKCGCVWVPCLVSSLSVVGGI